MAEQPLVPSASAPKTPPKVQRPQAQTTPIAHKNASSHTFSSQQTGVIREHHYQDLKDEMDNRFIGPLPVKDFLEAFLSRGVCGGDMPANLWTDAAKDAFKTVYTSQVAENSIRSSQAGQATDHSPAVAHTSNQSSEITQDSTHSSQTGSSSTRPRKPLETLMYRAMISHFYPYI
ncbi:hypothetical protein K435DRAFT_813074 [Dendrothele bispora CBS 962.96]|uniref:Uncharacterized protein n=1 Tax=Dendrothele bispora (strain CBS 962.96) TaxID=1314807 RepID=A0A4S8KME1_DENBC|nr:hypothetical protein K435DRAFT_813074 [Dendrothele bispora CBS 962.96]